MIREKIELLVLGSIFYCVGLFTDNLFLLLAGFATLVWCLTTCIYDHTRIKNAEKRRGKKIKQIEKETNENLNRLIEKLGSDDNER
jgi:hypothetical protein